MPRQTYLDAIVQSIDAGLWAMTPHPRTSSLRPSLTMMSPWVVANRARRPQCGAGHTQWSPEQVAAHGGAVVWYFATTTTSAPPWAAADDPHLVP